MDVVLNNIEHLYPISDSIAKFFLNFEELNKTRRNQIAKTFLRPIKKHVKHPPPEFYIMWILSIFSDLPSWNHAIDILGVYTNTKSEVVKRYAALALATTGKRPQALHLKDDFESASPLLQIAILACSHKLGDDEKKYWRRSLGLTRFLEKNI